MSVFDSATKLRHRRAARNLGCRFRMAQRDLWILEALAKMRFLTTSQLAGLHFQGSRWAANKRLRRLFDARLVLVWVRNLAQENVYSLDRTGARLIEGQDEDRGSWVVPRGLDGNLDHLLAINEVRISLALGLPGFGGEIAWWQSDWELRARGPERVIPDALFGIRWEQADEQVFALEIDNQTRSPLAFLKKILAYTSARRRGRGLYGTQDFWTLVVGRDERWIERYRLSLGHAQMGSTVWFATLQGIEAKGAIEEIWQPVDNDRKRSLRDLVSLPYGKEGVVSRMPTLTDS